MSKLKNTICIFFPHSFSSWKKRLQSANQLFTFTSKYLWGIFVLQSQIIAKNLSKVVLIGIISIFNPFLVQIIRLSVPELETVNEPSVLKPVKRSLLLSGVFARHLPINRPTRHGQSCWRHLHYLVSNCGFTMIKKLLSGFLGHLKSQWPPVPSFFLLSFSLFCIWPIFL